MSAILLIKEEKYIEKELYVKANVGFLDAIIIEVMTGKYVFINIVDIFIPVITSVNILLIGSIINDRQINMETVFIMSIRLLDSFRNDELIDEIRITDIIFISPGNIICVSSVIRFIKNLIILVYYY